MFKWEMGIYSLQLFTGYRRLVIKEVLTYCTMVRRFCVKCFFSMYSNCPASLVGSKDNHRMNIHDSHIENPIYSPANIKIDKLKINGSN